MSGDTARGPAAGHFLVALVAGWLLSGPSALAQQPSQPGPAVLARPVAPRPGNRPLGELLAELSRQSGLPFSYSSSLIPVGHRYQLPAGPPRPLGLVLGEVLAASHLSYGLLDGQLVLWPNHATLPAGVIALNGQPTSNGQPLPGLAAFATKEAAQAAGAGASAGRRPASQAASLVVAARPLAGIGSQPTLAVPLESRRRISNAPGTTRMTTRLTSPLASSPASNAPGITKMSATAQAAGLKNTQLAVNKAPNGQVGSPRRLGPTAQASGQLPVARASASQPLGDTALPGLPTGNQGKKTTESLDRATIRRPAAAASRWQPNNEAARSLGLLAPRTTTLISNKVPAIPPALGLLAAAKPAHEAASPSAPKKRLGLATIWDHTYLHGEVWLSETLPVGGTVKIGVQHAYLVLGAAIGPLDRRSGAVGGLGLGTAGRARGRFTPSLDAVAWFLSSDGDDGIQRARLLQLRPLLTWQLKRDGQVSLLAGPTLNLATANHNGNRQWSFGQDQWLWLNMADDQSIIRLWPGVQVGLRF